MTVDISIPFRNRLNRDFDKGALFDGEIRYLTMRPDALMGTFARLPEPARSQALNALTESVAEYGGRSIAAYIAANPAGLDNLMQVMTDTSADLGWGYWRFAQTDEGIDVIVENSPFAVLPAQGQVCAPIRGILTALAKSIADLQVTETSCRASTGGCECRFTLRPAS